MSTLKIVRNPRLERPTGAFELDVQSEVGLLHQVLVHTPGPELDLVSPENREDLLFEDILFIGRARTEHALMCRLVEKVVGAEGTVVQFAPLLRETFNDENARLDFVSEFVRLTPSANLTALEGDLERLAPDALFELALTGVTELPIHVAPVPNLYFTRDLASVVHDHVVLGQAATRARRRENLLMRIVLQYHPGFEAYRDRIIQLPEGVTFEGGDLLVAGPRVVLIGHSERTSFAGVMNVAEALLERTPVEHIVMVDLPKRRSSMHLDTVLTFSGEGECIVFPPLLEGAGNIMHIMRGNTDGWLLSEVRTGLKAVLEDVLERDVTFIPCGGTDPLSQQREQWTDGANVFAVAPNVIAGYERNNVTFDTLRRFGYRVVTAQGLLAFHEESDYDLHEKLAIKLEGNELSRGRGGPRCMTLPLTRFSTDFRVTGGDPA